LSEDKSSTTSGLSDSSIRRQLDQFWGRPADKSDGATQASDQFGKYQLFEALGYGAFGVVYRAINLESGAIVAVKLARPEVLLDAAKRERFVSEAAAAGSLSHPYIVKVLDAELEGSIPFIVSEFCEGVDLANWIARRDTTSLPIETTVAFIKKVVEAVGYAHSAGIVHRDIKPSNILVAGITNDTVEKSCLADLIPRLTDFGLAKVFDGPLLDSRSSLVLGTPMYMAPEQMISKWGPVTQRTDLYAIGMLLFELLEGRPLRHNNSYNEILGSLLGGNAIRIHFRRSDISPELKGTIAKCLAVDPIDRFASAADLLRALTVCSEGGSFESKTPKLLRRAITWARDPDRPVQICYYIIPINVVLFVWMILCCILGSMMLARFNANDFIQCIGISFGLSGTVIFLTFLRIRGHRWATVASLVPTIGGMVIVPVLAILGWIPSFETLYAENPYFDYVNHAQVLLLGLMQTILLGISLLCDWCQKNRAKEADFLVA
jgi:serine/threonine protein kinase